MPAVATPRIHPGGRGLASAGSSWGSAAGLDDEVVTPSSPVGDENVRSAPVQLADEAAWAASTHSQLSSIRALRYETLCQLQRSVMQSSVSTLNSEQNTFAGTYHGYSKAQDRLKRRQAASANIVATLQERMEGLGLITYRARQCVADLQRASGVMWAALSVADKRLELRAGRPQQELVRDHFQEALEAERDVILQARAALALRVDAVRELAASLEDIDGELHKDRHTLPMDRSSRPQELFARSRVLEEDAARACDEAGAALARAEREVGKSLARTRASMRRRIVETTDIRRQLEQELKETDRTIADAEWHLERSQKQLQDYLNAPERQIADSETETQFKEHAVNMGGAATAQHGIMARLRSKIKGSAYVGHDGRRLDVLFARFDKDGSGQLDEDEVRLALRRTLRIPPSAVTDAEISTLCSLLDADKSGEVSIQEIVAFLGADTNVEMLQDRVQSTSTMIAQLSAARTRMLADLRNKTQAWKIDESCTKVTPVMGLELDKLPSTHRSGGDERLRTPRKRRPPLERSLLEKLRCKMAASAQRCCGISQLETVLSRFSKNRAGQLDDEEVRGVLRRALRMPAAAVSDSEIKGLCGSLDTEGSGVVAVADLVAFIGGAAGDAAGGEDGRGGRLPSCLPASKRRLQGPPLAPEALERLRLTIRGAPLTSLDGVLRRFDKEGSGHIEDEDLRRVLRRALRVTPAVISDSELSSLCALLDAENSGSVVIGRFVTLMGPESPRDARPSLAATRLEPISRADPLESPSGSQGLPSPRL